VNLAVTQRRVPHLFEYSLLPNSCDGELEFRRGTEVGLPLLMAAVPIGNLTEALPGGSMGEVAAVEEPERGWPVPSWGM